MHWVSFRPGCRGFVIARALRAVPPFLAAAVTLAHSAQVPGLLYSTSFEAGENPPFVLGDLQGQNNWTVIEGTAVVGAGMAAHGSQAVQAGPGLFQLNVQGVPPVVWVDGFFRDPGGPEPMLPTNSAGSVIVFSAAEGLLALDGDGHGHGIFVQILPALPTDRFLRVTLREDYGAQRYDVWIDGVQRRTGLGFKDNEVTALNVVQRRAATPGYLDDFSVSSWGLDSDSDGDGINDLDEVKFYGTDPLDRTSCFALAMDRDQEGRPRVHIPTAPGRHYTLERRPTCQGEPWQTVPGLAGLPGLDGEMVFVETNAGPAFFYRATTTNP
jgi:hypothetical protein